MPSDGDHDMLSASEESDDDVFGGLAKPRQSDRAHSAAATAHTSGASAASAASAKVELPDFLRTMIRADQQRRHTEKSIAAKLQREGPKFSDLEDTRGFINNFAVEEGHDAADSLPFFLFCPPCQPAAGELQLRQAADIAPAGAPEDMRDVVRALGVLGQGRVAAPLAPHMRSHLVCLSVFHADPVVRTECCDTLCAHLKTDADAWTRLQAPLLCGLCDLGYPEEELGSPLRELMQAPDTPRSFVNYQGGDVRVQVRFDQRWCKGRLVRPAVAGETGRGAHFVVQLDRPRSAEDCDQTIQVVLPSSELLAESIDDDSDDDSDSEGDRQAAPLSPAADVHLYPLLQLLRPMLASGVGREVLAGKAWFGVLLRVLIFTSNACRPVNRTAPVGALVDAASSSCATVGSVSQAASACIEALLASFPGNVWLEVRSQLACCADDFLNPADDSLREDLLLSPLRRCWPVSPRAAELHRDIVQRRLRALLCAADLHNGMQVDGTDVIQVEELRSLMGRISLDVPAHLQAGAANAVVFLNGAALSSNDFYRILLYLRMCIQDLLERGDAGAGTLAADRRKEFTDILEKWYSHSRIKKSLQCRSGLQMILGLLE